MNLNDLKNPEGKPLASYGAGKKILILGFGKEGLDTLNFLRKIFPEKIIGVGDIKKEVRSQKSEVRKDKNIRWYLGENYLKAIADYDIIIKSPGIPIHLPEIEKAYKKGKITSQTEIFFENCPGKIVGITGTKGKSTTTALIYKILKEGGLRAHLVGNIGKPVLNLLLSATKNDIYVYELSSHQLYNLKKSPHIAVFLNIYSEHLDYYKNFNEYKNAKTNITRYQKKSDFIVYNSKDKEVIEIVKKSKAKKVAIQGEYYDLDIAAAKAVAKVFQIPTKKVEKAIKNFKHLPHRLEYVGTFKGIKFYNDALSTIPETAIAALNKLGDNVQTLFLGGFDRGLKFEKLADRILKSKVKNLILFPTTGEKIWEALRLASLVQGKKLPEHFFTNKMNKAVRWAYENTNKGKICLLSCASPSFSIFKDYKEKGNLFKKYVRKYKYGKIS
jgi:UDP-N-acetylmuramoylalanine--D-glutamate ligase